MGTLKRFFHDLSHEISEDNVSNGAAALAYYLTLAIFPAGILLLSLVPYLPIPNIDKAIMDMLGRIMPTDAAGAFTGTVRDITANKRSGLLSFGALGTLWAASSGTYAIMQQLNITYDVKEGRKFLKIRATSLGLTILLGVLIIIAFALVVLGGKLHDWVATSFALPPPVLTAFLVARWAITLVALLLAFAVTYYFGPDVDQKFRFITPGSAIGTLLLIATSLGFRYYVSHFGNYSATYGGLGAAIILMVWLYITGYVMLIGSEINALFEHYSAGGKQKGQKTASPKPAAKQAA